MLGYDRKHVITLWMCSGFFEEDVGCAPTTTELSRQEKKSANYMIKAVCTTDLSALAPFAITLNQERSAANVDTI